MFGSLVTRNSFRMASGAVVTLYLPHMALLLDAIAPHVCPMARRFSAKLISSSRGTGD
jgi:hypothetical protein